MYTLQCLVHSVCKHAHVVLTMAARGTQSAKVLCELIGGSPYLKHSVKFKDGALGGLQMVSRNQVHLLSSVPQYPNSFETLLFSLFLVVPRLFSYVHPSVSWMEWERSRQYLIWLKIQVLTMPLPLTIREITGEGNLLALNCAALKVKVMRKWNCSSLPFKVSILDSLFSPVGFWSLLDRLPASHKILCYTVVVKVGIWG
jgi:hypothetical protein